MNSITIQRHYDEVIASHYDRDPQSIIGDSLDKTIGHLQRHMLTANPAPLRVLDVGMGTGRFLQKLLACSNRPITPFGLDISEKMVAIARSRLPDLVAAVDDAANLATHFPTEVFDLIATHFITGFIPLFVLAPVIRKRLAEGGFWSFIGGTKAGFPTLRAKIHSPALRFLFRGKTLKVDDLVCNPLDQEEVTRTLTANGFVVRQCETFIPPLSFRDFDEFLEFAYWGGWLTPFIETLGLHRAGKMLRSLLNALVFPVEDEHRIVIVLAQKAAYPPVPFCQNVEGEKASSELAFGVQTSLQTPSLLTPVSAQLAQASPLLLRRHV